MKAYNKMKRPKGYKSKFRSRYRGNSKNREVVNKNGRRYTLETLEEALKPIRRMVGIYNDALKGNRFYGELNHPLSTIGSNNSKVNECSHVIDLRGGK